MSALRGAKQSYTAYLNEEHREGLHNGPDNYSVECAECRERNTVYDEQQGAYVVDTPERAEANRLKLLKLQHKWGLHEEPHEYRADCIDYNPVQQQQQQQAEEEEKEEKTPSNKTPEELFQEHSENKHHIRIDNCLWCRAGRGATMFGYPMITASQLQKFPSQVKHGLDVMCCACQQLPRCKVFQQAKKRTWCLDCAKAKFERMNGAVCIYNATFYDAYIDAKKRRGNEPDAKAWIEFTNRVCRFEK